MLLWVAFCLRGRIVSHNSYHLGTIKNTTMKILIFAAGQIQKIVDFDEISTPQKTTFSRW